MNTNSTDCTNCAQNNSRWSALETTTRKKSSERLRNMLYHQDFCMGDSNPTLDSTSYTLPIPAVRKASLNSMGSMASMSTISSMGSYGSMNSHRFSSRKSSSSKVMRHSKRNSKNSLLSLNTRWKSTPPNKSKSKSTNANNILHARGNHNGRWMATVSSDSAIDRPISVIQRKASRTTILPSSVSSKPIQR
jgi:hypothetical protein